MASDKIYTTQLSDGSFSALLRTRAIGTGSGASAREALLDLKAQLVTLLADLTETIVCLPL